MASAIDLDRSGQIEAVRHAPDSTAFVGATAQPLPTRRVRAEYGVPFDAPHYMPEAGFAQPGNLPYTADELRALADRMDASGTRRGDPSMGLGTSDSTFAGRASQKPHAGTDLRASRDMGPASKPDVNSGNRRSGSRGVTASAPRPQSVAAPRPDAKPMLTQDAYIKRQQLRWLLKKRLGQVRDALAAMQSKGAQRTLASLKTDPEPTPGLFLPTIKGDFEQSFARPLSYKEFGVERLGQLLLRECDDILQEPMKISQFMPMVHGQSTAPSGGETKAASRMAGRQHAPVLNESTCMHVTKVLRHYGYSTEDVAEYAKTLPQPKSKAEKNQKAGKQAAAAAAPDAQPESGATANADATAVVSVAGKGKGTEKPSAVAADAGGSGGGQPPPAGGPAGDEVPTGDASGIQAKARDILKGSNGAEAAGVEADAANTLVASNANVLGMASDDEDMPPAAAAAPVAATGHKTDGNTGNKRKSGAIAGAGKARSETIQPESAESTFWEDHAEPELMEVERDFIVGLRARVYNYAFYSTTTAPFMIAVTDGAPPGSGGPAKKKRRRNQQSMAVKLDEYGQEDAAERRMRLTSLDTIPCPQGSVRQVMLDAISPGLSSSVRKATGTMLACDVSDVLEDMLSDVLAAESADGSTPQECTDLCKRVRQAPEWFLGLAAMPLTLRKLPDGRLVVSPATNAFSADRCVAVRRLRQAVVVSLLDAAPGVRELLGGPAAGSSVAERVDEGGTSVPCLLISEVVRRVEGLIQKDLLKLLLAAVRCSSTVELLGSVHVADLVHRLPAEPPAVCASFGPLLDLRLTMDRRLSYLSTVAAAAIGGDSAADKLRKASYSVPFLLKDHAIMWGYTFVPQWTGVDGVAKVVRELLGDMVTEVRSGSQGLVRASPATLMRHLLRVKLNDVASAAAADGAETGDAAAAEAEAPAEVAPVAEGEGAIVPAAECEGGPDAPAPGVVKEEAAEIAAASADVEMADATAETPQDGEGAAVVEGAEQATAEAGGGHADAGDRQGQVEGQDEGGGAGGVRVKEEPADNGAAAEAGDAAVGGERLRGAGSEEGAAEAEEASGTVPPAATAAAPEQAADTEPQGGEQAAAGGADATGGQARNAGNDTDVIMLGDTEDEAGADDAAADNAAAEGAGEKEGAGEEGGGHAEAAAAADAGTPGGDGALAPVAVKQEVSAAAAETEAVSAAGEGAAKAVAVSEAANGAEGEPVAHEHLGDPAGATPVAAPASGAGGAGGDGKADEEETEAGEIGADGDAAAAAADDAAGGARVHVIDDDDDSASGDTAVATADNESGGSTGVVAARGVAGGGSAAARDDDWVLLRTTPEELLREYKARYGAPFIAAGVGGMKEALQAVEWEYEVEWEAGDVALSVRDRLEKQGVQRVVADEQRAVLRQYLQQAHVQFDPTALLGGKAKPTLEDKAGAGGKAAKGGDQVLGKRKELEGAKASPASKMVKKGERGVTGPQGRGPGKTPEGVRGRSAIPAGQPMRPPRPSAPLRTAAGFSGARGASTGPVPPRRNSPMPRANLRPVPVHNPRRSVPPKPGVLRQPMRMDGPPRYVRSPSRPAVTPVPRERPTGMEKRGRDSYWQPSRPGYNRHEDIGGYVRGGSAQRGGPDAGGHRVPQDRYRRQLSPGPGEYGRGGYRHRGDPAPSSGSRYAHSGARSGSMIDEPRHAPTQDAPRYDRRTPVQDSAPVHYAANGGAGVPGLATSGAGYVTVVPGSVYGGRQAVANTRDAMHSTGARYAAPSAPQEVQQAHAVQPATVQVLSAPASAQAGGVYRLATVPGGGTVLINAGPPVEGVQGAQQTFPQAYAQYAVDSFGRVQPQQQRSTAQYDDRPVRRDGGSLQPYSVQDASTVRPSRQYTQDRYY